MEKKKKRKEKIQNKKKIKEQKNEVKGRGSDCAKGRERKDQTRSRKQGKS